MRVVGFGASDLPDGRQAAIAMRQGAVMMARGPMNQIPVLGAANVLHQEHVASARAHKGHDQQRGQRATTSNH